MRLSDLLILARESIVDPRKSFRALQALRLDRGTLWTGLLAVAAISVILAWSSALLAEMRGVETAIRYLPGPLATGGVEVVVLAVMGIVVFWGGRMFGGRGTFDDALLAVVWLQFVLNCLQVLQLVTFLIVPFIADLIGLAGLVLSLWMLTGFVAEQHGFRSMGKTLAGILAAMVLVAIALVIVLVMIGVGAPETPNV